MTTLILVILAQVEPFKVESKKITPEIRKEIERLDGLRLDAYQKACAAVGAQLPKEHRIILRLIDGADPDPARFSLHDGIAAATSSRNDTTVEIRFHAEYFVNGLLQPEETLRHELVHAVMRIDLRKAPYQKLPKWLREGIAVHLAGQTPSKLAYGFMRKEIAFDPGKMIDGLQDPDHSLDDYAEDGLAMAHLVEAAGPDALVRLESELRGGLGHREAIEKVTGGRFLDFDTAARTFAEKRVREEAVSRAKELELYRDILDKNEKSRPECEKFLALFPKSSLRSAVLYYAAKSAGDGALPAYDAFIESARKPDGYAGFIDDALLRKARLLVEAGRISEAVTVYSHLVYWHVGSGNAVTALYEWGLELFPTAKATSTPLLQRALEINPKHRHAAEARKRLGQ